MLPIRHLTEDKLFNLEGGYLGLVLAFLLSPGAAFLQLSSELHSSVSSMTAVRMKGRDAHLDG